MSMLEQVVRLDMKPQKNPPHVDCTQYDSGSDGWLIRAYLFNNGSKFTIPTDYTAKIEGTTKENTGFTFAATNIDNANGAVTFELTEDATAFKGSAWCKIVFEKGSSRIATSGFWLDNDRAGVEADTIIGAPGFEEQIAEAAEAWLEEQDFSSPTVDVTEITGGHRVTVTDYQGSESFDVMNGVLVATIIDGDTLYVDNMEVVANYDEEGF